MRDTHYTDTADYAPLLSQITDAPANTATIILEHSDHYAIAKHCKDVFLEIYAQAIANLALTTLPFGGLFVAGGIAPKLKDHFNSPSFKNHLFDKGRMSGLIQEIPMHIILETKKLAYSTGTYQHISRKSKNRRQSCLCYTLNIAKKAPLVNKN